MLCRSSYFSARGAAINVCNIQHISTRCRQLKSDDLRIVIARSVVYEPAYLISCNLHRFDPNSLCFVALSLLPLNLAVTQKFQKFHRNNCDYIQTLISPPIQAEFCVEIYGFNCFNLLYIIQDYWARIRRSGAYVVVNQMFYIFITLQKENFSKQDFEFYS
jgi:hypothetical protein